jgi:hypothetical protein
MCKMPKKICGVTTEELQRGNGDGRYKEKRRPGRREENLKYCFRTPTLLILVLWHKAAPDWKSFY